MFRTLTAVGWRDLMRYVDQVFEDTDVILDGNEYERCVFRRTRITYSAYKGGGFSYCEFYECRWALRGPAADTLQFLSATFNGLGEEGRALVEKTFDNIRDGSTFGASPSQSEFHWKPRIFIGHGRSADYALLKNYLTDRGYEVENFESGPRAGHSAKDVIEGMARRASMAFLVHTAEDEQDGVKARARQNVVHETGLFQGRLGFERAIVVREEGCEEFSNLAGVQYISFRKGNIKDAFGEVSDTILREFPPAR